MPLFNNKAEEKQRLAYLGALTLLFSYAELFIPRIVPFFRLGLGNVPVLLGLTLEPFQFALLLLIKTFCSSMMAGTLYTPFFMISLIQSVASGFVMYVLFNLSEMFRKKPFSCYGISVAGSAASAVVQIECCKIYLGEGTSVLFGPMLLFSVISGIFTAFLRYALAFPETAPVFKTENQTIQPGLKIWPLIKVVLILIAAIVIFMLNDWKVLLPVMMLCLILQKISGRKILLLPYLGMWIFIIISCLLVPQGKILFSFWSMNITYGALMEGLTKAMVLTSICALSQCLVGIKFTDSRFFVTLVFNYYQRLQKAYEKAEGGFMEKLKTALCAKEL